MKTLTSFLFLIKQALIFCIRPLMKDICMRVCECVYVHVLGKKERSEKEERVN